MFSSRWDMASASPDSSHQYAASHLRFPRENSDLASDLCRLFDIGTASDAWVFHGSKGAISMHSGFHWKLKPQGDRWLWQAIGRDDGQVVVEGLARSRAEGAAYLARAMSRAVAEAEGLVSA